LCFRLATVVIAVAERRAAIAGGKRKASPSGAAREHGLCPPRRQCFGRKKWEMAAHDP